MVFSYALFGHRIASSAPLFGLVSDASLSRDSPVIYLEIDELSEPVSGETGSDVVEFDDNGLVGSMSLTRSSPGVFSILAEGSFVPHARRVSARFHHDVNACRLEMRATEPLDPLEVLSFLLSPSMPLWLRATQRFLPLHAAVVAMDGKAVAICGRSGAGKTTLALHCRKRSFAIIADDMAAIDWNTGLVQHGAAFSRIDCQQFSLIDSVERTHHSPRLPKYLFDTRQHDYWSAPRPLPLAGVFMVSAFHDDQAVCVERVPDIEAGIALSANLTGEMFPPTKAQRQAGLSASMAVAQRVPVYRLRRPRGLDHLDASVDAIYDRIHRDQ